VRTYEFPRFEFPRWPSPQRRPAPLALPVSRTPTNRNKQQWDRGRSAVCGRGGRRGRGELAVSAGRVQLAEGSQSAVCQKRVGGLAQAV